MLKRVLSGFCRCVKWANIDSFIRHEPVLVQESPWLRALVLSNFRDVCL